MSTTQKFAGDESTPHGEAAQNDGRMHRVGADGANDLAEKGLCDHYDAHIYAAKKDFDLGIGIDCYYHDVKCYECGWESPFIKKDR